jgi:tRNA-dihydrouridine synthase B
VIAKLCEEAGADYIAVHGRTRAGRYKAPVDYDALAEIKQNIGIPMFANGDIDSPEKAKWVREYTGAEGIMIGRAAVGKPWIFRQIKEGMAEPTPELIKEVVLEHFDQMIAHYDKYGAIIFRKNLHSYSKAGYQGAAVFRNEVNRIEDPQEMRDVVEAFFSQNFIGTLT